MIGFQCSATVQPTVFGRSGFIHGTSQGSTSAYHHHLNQIHHLNNYTNNINNSNNSTSSSSSTLSSGNSSHHLVSLHQHTPNLTHHQLHSLHHNVHHHSLSNHHHNGSSHHFSLHQANGGSPIHEQRNSNSGHLNSSSPHPHHPSHHSNGTSGNGRSVSPPNLLDYYPGLGGDGLRLDLISGVNSRSKLCSLLLSNDTLMIGADVTLAETTRYPIPIMATLPMNLSDITLEDWLIEVIRSETSKGIKLHFKSTRVVEPAFRVLARHAEYIKGPIILNADILPGPNKSGSPPVDAWTFLMLCRTRFSKAIISIGWTGLLEGLDEDEENEDDERGNKLMLMSSSKGYTREMVDQMASLVKEYSLMQPVTFPVNASLLKTSISEIQRLLFQVPNSTLTICCNDSDNICIDDLLMIRKSFGQNQLFYDIPNHLLNELRNEVYIR